MVPLWVNLHDKDVQKKKKKKNKDVFMYTLKKCWVASTQIWVKYGQTQMLG